MYINIILNISMFTKVSTHQLVLVTDGVEPYAMYNYGDVQ